MAAHEPVAVGEPAQGGGAGVGLVLDLPHDLLESDTRRDWYRIAVERSGIEIGGHTISHAHLCELSDAELATRACSIRDGEIEAELGRPLLAPGVSLRGAGWACASRSPGCGYEAAFGLQPHDSTWDDRFRLPRVGVWRDEGGRTFAFKTLTVGRSALLAALRRARNCVAPGITA